MPCAVDGTVDVTVDVSDPQTISVNDRFTFEFTDCDDGTGVILDGGLEMTVSGFVSNLSLTITENGTAFPPSVAIDTAFRISTPRIGGDVIVSTSLGLESSGDGFPFMGELEIRAAGDAVIVIIALGADLVRLEIDIDGDTVPDEVVDMSWEELLAAANAA